MKPLVYQVVLVRGWVPFVIQECIMSVRNYASRMGYDYLCDDGTPEWVGGMTAVVASEWMRVEKLASRPYVCYIDWDVKVVDDFELGEGVMTVNTMDMMLYFGREVEIGKRLLEGMGERRETSNLRDRVMDELVCSGVRVSLLSSKKYEHLKYNKSGVKF